jgi:AraC family transcriptional regulator, activator of mtrCDE
MATDFCAALLGLRAKLTYAGGVCGRWGIDHNSDSAIWVHLVTKGRAWIHSHAWTSPLALDEGDIVVFLPFARTHYFSHSADELVFDSPDARKVPLEEGSTAFVCAVIDLGAPQASFWRALPAEIVVRGKDTDGALADLTRLLVAEARHYRFGSFSVIERLCDSVFVLLVRHCIDRALVGRGVFLAMRDSRLEKAVGLIHREPGFPWTVKTLGGRVGLAKSALTEKFVEALGCAPKEYLIHWRMQLAANWLRESTIAVELIAEQCGYYSVSAFSRTFKQYHGVAPGAYRRAPTRARNAQPKKNGAPGRRLLGEASGPTGELSAPP